MIEIVFDLNQVITKIQGNIKEPFKNIIDRYIQKSNYKRDELCFIGNGEIINENNIIENIMSQDDKNNNRMNILVEIIIKDENGNKIIKSKDIILKNINNNNIKDKLYDILNLYDNMNKNEINNEMTIIYKNDENKIKLFDKNFINNNKDNCYLIINNEKTELKEYLEINNNKLKQIEIKLYETKPITNMYSMFYSCSSLQSLPDISKWNTEKVTYMSYMFNCCR